MYTYLAKHGILLYLSCSQAKEALGLVRAVADHEKLRQEHLKRMKSLRKQLEMLEGAKG